MPKKRRRKSKPLKLPCLHFMRELEKLQDLASDHNLLVVVTEFGSRGRKSLHVMFNYDSQRVLDYWPATGTIYNRERNLKNKVNDCWAALDEAARLSCLIRGFESHLSAISRTN